MLFLRVNRPVSGWEVYLLLQESPLKSRLIHLWLVDNRDGEPLVNWL